MIQIMAKKVITLSNFLTFLEGHGLAEALCNAEQTLGLALYDVPNNELSQPTPINEVIDFCKERYPNAHVYPVATDLDVAAGEVKPVS